VNLSCDFSYNPSTAASLFCLAPLRCPIYRFTEEVLPVCHAPLHGSIPEILLKMSTADIVVGEGAPEFAQLVCEAGEASTDDGPDVQRGHFVRVLGDEVTQLVPKVIRFSLLGHKAFVIHNSSQSHGCFVQAADRVEVVNVLLAFSGESLRYLRYTLMAVSGRGRLRAKRRYRGQMRGCWVTGSALSARSNVLRLLVILH